MKGMNKAETVNETARQSKWWRYKATCRSNQANEEYVLSHTSSLPEERIAVQAEVIMPYLRIL
jgi:hypothetical protein